MIDEGSKSVERYELLGELAFGGMATVYLGRQRGEFGFMRTVAIKSMHPHLARDPSFRAMFIDEANLTARIRHPNVVPTLDIVSSATKLLLVMEYVEGVALSVLLSQARKQKRKLPVSVISTIVRDVLEGLHAAHELVDDSGKPLGVVHRDISPQNILVGVDGIARVVDFGVAKANQRSYQTQTGEVRGKVGYMAPEQMFGENVDRRVDIYATGVVLWEALVGERLFDAPTDAALVLLVTQGMRNPPSTVRGERLPEGLDALAGRALRQDPAERWSTASEMARELAKFAEPAERVEVGALVRELCREQLAVGTAHLRGSRPAATTEDLDPESRAILDVLTRATMTQDNIQRITNAPQSRGRALLPIFGVLLLLVAAVLSTRAIVKQSVATSPATSTTATPSALPDPGVLPSGSVSVEAAPAAPPAPEPAPLPSGKAPKHPTKKPTAPHGTPSPAPAPAPTPATPRPECTPPYVTDEEGHRHYKAECLK